MLPIPTVPPFAPTHLCQPTRAGPKQTESHFSSRVFSRLVEVTREKRMKSVFCQLWGVYVRFLVSESVYVRFALFISHTISLRNETKREPEMEFISGRNETKWRRNEDFKLVCSFTRCSLFSFLLLQSLERSAALQTEFKLQITMHASF